MIWAAARAMAFRVLSNIDFLGGGGGISMVPWCRGSACHRSLAERNSSEICSLTKARETFVYGPTLAAASPARQSARSLPGMHEWPLTHWTPTVCRLFMAFSLVTQACMRLAQPQYGRLWRVGYGRMIDSRPPHQGRNLEPSSAVGQR